MSLNWFLSRTVRHATQMRRHVWKILNAQRDLLSPQAIQAVQTALGSLQQATAGPFNKTAVEEQMANLEQIANKWLKPYPNAGLRENIDVLLVAIAVAMGIRTFFLQPFKIPTGSMQPTLYGITHENLIDRLEVKIPSVVQRFFQYWISGVGYTSVRAKVDGSIDRLYPPRRFLLFNLWQQFQLGGVMHTVWFPPEGLWPRAELADRMGLPAPKVFKKGEYVIKLKAISGDHLFVDRMTYNFRRPNRGEIIVFETRGIAGIREQDQFYIKRLVALGGERVRIGNDRHLIIDGKRLDAATPHFELVYSLDGPPVPSKFSGHVNDYAARQYLRPGEYLAPLFPDENAEVTVRPNHYMVMGDNTLNSFDSRGWGDFPRTNVIGRSFFVYWPIGSQDGRPSRFGWGHR